MTKAWSLVDLVLRFQHGVELTPRQAADNYRVPLRTAQRWLAECAEHGVAEKFRQRGVRTPVWRGVRR